MFAAVVVVADVEMSLSLLLQSLEWLQMRRDD